MTHFKRCFGEGQKFYEAYHDFEWAVPLHDDQKLFEMLSLEGAQAGLSWALILKRRAHYQEAFHHFDPLKVSQMSDEELEDLYENGSIIRNRLKIFSVRKNAKIFLDIQNEFGSFDTYVWSFVDGKTIDTSWKTFEDVPCLSQESENLSKDLKKRGMTFVGPKIIYSFMQAIGMVNDHLESCPARHSKSPSYNSSN